jgi:menaquinol-cytochrome c reductase iron-sulfur subunit
VRTFQLLDGSKNYYMNNNQDPENRRKLLVRLSLWVATIPAAAASVPVLGALFGPLIDRPKQKWRKIALATDIAIGETKLVAYINADSLPWSGTTAKSAAWVRRQDEKTFIAFSANCTHLGCPVRWMEDAQLFMCPCHGGAYYKNGEVAAGPPPKPLTQYQVRLNNNSIELKTAPVPITGMEYEKKD